MKKEKWAEFPGVDSYYLSSKGRVYSTKTKRMLKLELNNSGYSRIKLRGKYYFIHIKIVEAFGDKNGSRIPKECRSLIQKGLSIDHIDRNKHNNSKSNLELVTHSENCLRRRSKAMQQI